jgi:hypothetical protein
MSVARIERSEIRDDTWLYKYFPRIPLRFIRATGIISGHNNTPWHVVCAQVFTQALL